MVDFLAIFDDSFGILSPWDQKNRDGKSRGNQMKDPTSETSPQFVCDYRHENIKTGGFNPRWNKSILGNMQMFQPIPKSIGVQDRTYLSILK